MLIWRRANGFFSLGFIPIMNEFERRECITLQNKRNKRNKSSTKLKILLRTFIKQEDTLIYKYRVRLIG